MESFVRHFSDGMEDKSLSCDSSFLYPEQRVVIVDDSINRSVSPILCWLVVTLWSFPTNSIVERLTKNKLRNKIPQRSYTRI